MMKINYDPDTDSLTIIFRRAPVRESDELSANVIADFDEAGEIGSIEVLRASRVIADSENVIYERSA